MAKSLVVSREHHVSKNVDVVKLPPVVQKGKKPGLRKSSTKRKRDTRRVVHVSQEDWGKGVNIEDTLLYLRTSEDHKSIKKVFELYPEALGDAKKKWRPTAEAATGGNGLTHICVVFPETLVTLARESVVTYNRTRPRTVDRRAPSTSAGARVRIGVNYPTIHE